MWVFFIYPLLNFSIFFSAKVLENVASKNNIKTGIQGHPVLLLPWTPIWLCRLLPWPPLGLKARGCLLEAADRECEVERADWQGLGPRREGLGGSILTSHLLQEFCMGWNRLHGTGQGSPLVSSMWVHGAQPCSPEQGEEGWRKYL